MKYNKIKTGGGNATLEKGSNKQSIVLLQSYCSPSPMSNDYGVYQVLQNAFDIKVVYKQTSTTMPIYIKDIWLYALKANLTAKKGETIFS